MSNFAKFMKQNKIQKENTFYPATKSLTDEEGNPLMWEIRPLTTKQDEDIRDVCTKEIPMQGRSNAYRPKFDANLYMNKLVVASTVCPDLYDAELQDSYGVKTPEELVKEMLDNPGEYQNLVLFIQEYNGFTNMQDKVEEAKN